jgi:RNA polymerase sigma-70 factor (ECF subfamily)
MNLRLQKWDSEEKLIRSCQKGEASAQREIYNRFSRKMLAVCMRYINQHMEAEDVMINGFMRVFDKIEQFKYEGSFEGWLRRIMVNEALGYIRKNKSLFMQVDIEDVHQQPGLYHIDSDGLEAEDLLNLVQQLPTGYRTVFNLYAIEGYSHKEIAETLGISENTSKSQLSRSRALLQQLLVNVEKKTEVLKKEPFESRIQVSAGSR